MKKIFYVAAIFWFITLTLWYTYGADERKLVAVIPDISYLNYKEQHVKKFPHDLESIIVRCYAVYNALLDMNYVKDSYNADIKTRLVAVGFCDLDETYLVLKGFPLEDSLKVLMGSQKVKK